VADRRLTARERRVLAWLVKQPGGAGFVDLPGIGLVTLASLTGREYLEPGDGFFARITDQGRKAIGE